jgi:hypothetical protein
LKAHKNAIIAGMACLLLAGSILITSCSCDQHVNNDDSTGKTESSEINATIASDASSEQTVTTYQTEPAASDPEDQEYVLLTEEEINVLAVKIEPIMTGIAQSMYNNGYDDLTGIDNEEFMLDTIWNVCTRIHEGEDSFVLTYAEVEQIVRSIFPDFTGDIASVISGDQVTFDKETMTFRMTATDVEDVTSEVIIFKEYYYGSYSANVLLLDEDREVILQEFRFWLKKENFQDYEGDVVCPVGIEYVSRADPLSPDLKENRELNAMLPVLWEMTYEMYSAELKDFEDREVTFNGSLFLSVAYYCTGTMYPSLQWPSYGGLELTRSFAEEIAHASYVDFSGDVVELMLKSNSDQYVEASDSFYIYAYDPSVDEEVVLDYFEVFNDGSMNVVMKHIMHDAEEPLKRYRFHLVPNVYSLTIDNPTFAYTVEEITALD